MAEKQLVVVTGMLGAGKTTLSKRLESEHGFEYRCIGDELARIYRQENNLPEDEPVSGLARMAVHKRVRQDDPEYFSRFVTEEPYTRRVVDGLRNLRDANRAIIHGATIVSLVAPAGLRIPRVVDRDVTKDPSIEAIREREQKELNDPDPDGSQLLAVMDLAKDNGFFVDASGSQEYIFNQVAGELGLQNTTVQQG